jgi:ABC-type multidrug transport system fused ATPase/permease subunit
MKVERERVLRRLIGDFLVRRGLVVLALLSEIGLGGTQLYLTWLVKLWVEGPLYSGDSAALWRLAGLALAALSSGALCLFGARYFAASVNQRFIESLRNRAVDRLPPIPGDLAHPAPLKHARISCGGFQ